MRVTSNKSSNSITCINCITDWVIVSHSILVKDVSMSMGEGSSFYILTGNSHVMSILNQTCKCQSFCSSPINAFTILNCCMPLFKDSGYESMEFTLIFWKNCNFVSNVLQSLNFNARNFGFHLINLFDFIPLICYPIFSFIFSSFACLICIFKFISNVLFHFFTLFFGNSSIFDEFFFV